MSGPGAARRRMPACRARAFERLSRDSVTAFFSCGAQWAAYFAAFEKQAVPTDALGNPLPDAGPITR